MSNQTAVVSQTFPDGSPVTLDFAQPSGSGISLLASGHLDGGVRVHRFEHRKTKNSLSPMWNRFHKQSVRRIRFGRMDIEHLYTITRNRALTQWHTDTGRKLRCIQKAHRYRPYSLCCLKLGATLGQCIATGDEQGCVHTWDMRAEQPLISTYNNQEEDITDMCMAETSSGCVLLATSNDATLCAYDLRARKMLMRSEPMHTELLSVSVVPTTGQTLCGSGDGHIELFQTGEWGNISGRFDSAHDDNVDCIRVVNSQCAVTASGNDGIIRSMRVNPCQRLPHTIGSHTDGVEELCVSADTDWLASCGLDDRIKIWSLTSLKHSIPLNEGTKKMKMNNKSLTKIVDSAFFDELCSASTSG